MVQFFFLAHVLSPSFIKAMTIKATASPMDRK
jgi:hypothetical protein